MSDDKKLLEDIQVKILENLSQRLLEKLESGEATAAEMRVALDLLKANGITTENLTEIEKAVTSFNVDDLDGAPIDVMPFEYKREVQG